MAASSARERAARWAVSWPALVLLFFVPAAVWARSGPLFSVPDEPAHTVKAVAVWYGQLNGTDAKNEFGYIATTFDIPAVWSQVNDVPGCYAFQRNNTADCAPTFPNDRPTTAVTSTAGHYPPLYYLLVGWGGRVSESSRGVYLMRLASALAGAVLLAWAARALLRVLRPPLAVLSVLVAATPMVYFLAGSVNPNGFEIAASVAVWAHVLAIVRWRERGDAPVPRALLVGLLVTGALLAFTRSLSPPFLALIVGLALLAGSWRTLRALAREKAVVGTFVALGGIAVLAMVAVVASGHLALVPGAPLPADVDPWRETIGMGDIYVKQMIAWFGWLDTRQATLTVYLWLAVVFGLIIGSLMLARLRENLALVATVVVTALLPIVAQAPRAAEQGLAWQGRYTLPIAVGIPLLALVAIDRHAEAVRGLTRRIAVSGAVLVGIGNLYALWWNLRRYTVGGDNEVMIFDGPWQPPLGSRFWLAVLFLAAAGAVAVCAVASDAAPAGADADPGRTGEDDDRTPVGVGADGPMPTGEEP